MRLDILAEIDGKEKINIEMQNKNEYNIVNRNDGYASGIYYNSLQIGDKYLNGTKTVVIWILGYNYFKDGNYHEIIKQRREYNNEVFSPNITTHIFQLPRFIENVEEINKIVDIVMTDQDVRDALNDRILAQQLENLKMERAYENGEKKGKREGKREGKKEISIKIAKEMIKKGFDIKEIIELTWLDEDEVIKLKENKED